MPYLLFQAAQLRIIGTQHIVDAQDVLFGGLELQFRFVAARLQSGGAGSFFQNLAAILRFGADKGVDLALAD